MRNKNRHHLASHRLDSLSRHSLDILILLVLPCLLILTGCNHKELGLEYVKTASLRIEYDWQDAPEANPAGMCAILYATDREAQHIRFDFKGMNGGEVELPVGTYRIITYNNDTEVVQFDNIHDFDSHRGYTREGNILEPIYGNAMPLPPRAEGTEDERVVITPDELWGCTEVDVTVTGEGDQVITLRPHDMLCHYSYEIRNVSNLKHVTQMSASLTGMAGAMDIATESLSREPVTLPFEAYPDGASTVIGNFHTFGHHEENPDPHKMSLYVVMDDGAKYVYSADPRFDVTDQIHSAPNRRRVHIIIDGLSLPQPIENGSGFAPEVDDWGEVKEDIIL